MPDPDRLDLTLSTPPLDASADRPSKRKKSAVDLGVQHERGQSVLDLQEWLGLVTLGAKDKLRLDRDQDDMDTFGLDPAHCESEPGQATSISWTGFFHPRAVQHVSRLLVECVRRCFVAQSWTD